MLADGGLSLVVERVVSACSQESAFQYSVQLNSAKPFAFAQFELEFLEFDDAGKGEYPYRLDRSANGLYVAFSPHRQRFLSSVVRLQNARPPLQSQA